MSKRISWASFHQAVSIPYPGPGSIGTSCPPVTKTLKGLEMHHEVEGIRIVVNGDARVEALIPWANVVVAQYEPEAAKVVSIKK